MSRSDVTYFKVLGQFRRGDAEWNKQYFYQSSWGRVFVQEYSGEGRFNQETKSFSGTDEAAESIVFLHSEARNAFELYLNVQFVPECKHDVSP